MHEQGAACGSCKGGAAANIDHIPTHIATLGRPDSLADWGEGKAQPVAPADWLRRIPCVNRKKQQPQHYDLVRPRPTRHLRLISTICCNSCREPPLTDTIPREHAYTLTRTAYLFNGPREFCSSAHSPKPPPAPSRQGIGSRRHLLTAPPSSAAWAVPGHPL